VKRELDPQVAAALERLDRELVASEPHGDLAAKLEWVIKLLEANGVLTERHRKILKRIRANRSLPIVFGSPDDVPDPDIDCASLLHLCRARCCSCDVALTPDEVRAGKVEWNLMEPYRLAKNPETGYCTHLGDTGGCTKYEDRPGMCRKYDCRKDPRVWVDFDAKIPAPMPWDTGSLPWLPDE
jgi:hypothetical protein